MNANFFEQLRMLMGYFFGDSLDNAIVDWFSVELGGCSSPSEIQKALDGLDNKLMSHSLVPLGIQITAPEWGLLSYHNESGIADHFIQTQDSDYILDCKNSLLGLVKAKARKHFR